MAQDMRPLLVVAELLSERAQSELGRIQQRDRALQSEIDELREENNSKTEETLVSSFDHFLENTVQEKWLRLKERKIEDLLAQQLEVRVQAEEARTVAARALGKTIALKTILGDS